MRLRGGALLRGTKNVESAWLAETERLTFREFSTPPSTSPRVLPPPPTGACPNHVLPSRYGYLVTYPRRRITHIHGVPPNQRAPPVLPLCHPPIYGWALVFSL